MFIINFKLIFTGIKNFSPSLYLIHLIKNNFKLEENFFSENFSKKRIEENLLLGFIKKNNEKYQITKKGKFVLIFFVTLKKVFNI